jgi:protein-S-isoprenylcysteine O-methyltransferase Ste14
MIAAGAVMAASWIVFLIVWFASAFNTKRDVIADGGFSRMQPAVARFALAAAMILLLLLFRGGHAGWRWRHHYLLFHPGLALLWLGAALNVLGIGFAVWARVHLGRNWSSRPSIKEGHELVTGGPYAFVRHPIYSGMILALLGLALTGLLSGALVFIPVTVIFLRRVVREEQIMMQLFPEQYPAYRQRTKRLIPLVW